MRSSTLPVDADADSPAVSFCLAAQPGLRALLVFFFRAALSLELAEAVVVPAAGRIGGVAGEAAADVATAAASPSAGGE